jgi:hypothetical protein
MNVLDLLPVEELVHVGNRKCVWNTRLVMVVIHIRLISEINVYYMLTCFNMLKPSSQYYTNIICVTCMIHLPPIRYLLSINPFIILFNRIGGLMVSVLASSAVDCGFEPKTIVAWHQLSNCSAISWREQVNFQWNDDEVHFVPDQHPLLDLYCASTLKQQSAICVTCMIHLPPIRYLLSINPFIILFNRIRGAMVSVLASIVVDHGFQPWSGETKGY